MPFYLEVYIGGFLTHPRLDRCSTEATVHVAGTGFFWGGGGTDFMPYLALLRVARWPSLSLGQEGMAGVLSLALSYTQASVSRPLRASPLRFLGLFQNIQEKIFVTNQL